MVILWAIILCVMGYKLPYLTIVLVSVLAMILFMIALIAMEEDKREKERYTMVEFNQDMLERFNEKTWRITRGSGIHIYRFMRDPRILKAGKRQERNYLGEVKFDDHRKNFTVFVPLVGKFQEVLVLDPKNLNPVKIIPSVTHFTLSCDPREFNAIQVSPGRYLVWVRALGDTAPPDVIARARVSRDRYFTVPWKHQVIPVDFITNPEGLRDLATEYHHDNHTRTKLAEYSSKSLNIFPRSPYIKAYRIEAELDEGEVAFLFLENSRLNSIFHNLTINGTLQAINIDERSQIAVKISKSTSEEPDKIEYTQFLYDTRHFKDSDVARPFMTRYSRSTSHFYDDLIVE